MIPYDIVVLSCTSAQRLNRVQKRTESPVLTLRPFPLYLCTCSDHRTQGRHFTCLCVWLILPQGLSGPPGPEGAEGKPGTQVPILYHISIPSSVNAVFVCVTCLFLLSVTYWTSDYYSVKYILYIYGFNPSFVFKKIYSISYGKDVTC